MMQYRVCALRGRNGKAMLQFKRNGKVVEGGILLAPDFVVDAVVEYSSIVSLLGTGATWQGTGIGILGDFETWEILTVAAPR